MTDYPSVEDWKQEFSPLLTDDVSEAISEDSSWSPSQTGMGRLHEMEIVEKLQDLSSSERVIEVGSSEGLTTLELSMILPDSDITGLDIDQRAVDRAVQNRQALESYQDFLSGLESADSVDEAISSCKQDDLGLDVDLSNYFSGSADRYSFRSIASEWAVPEPVEYVSRQIARADDWESALNDYVARLDGTGDVGFQNLGALQVADAEGDYDLVFAPNSIGTLANTAVFSTLGRMKREESDLYNQVVDETDDLSEFISDSSGKSTQAAEELFMEQFLDQVADATAMDGDLVIADGRQYIHMVQDDGWRAVEGRGAVSERKQGMCKTYQEKRAEELYETWLGLEKVDTEGYTEKMINRSGELEHLYQIVDGEKIELS